MFLHFSISYLENRVRPLSLLEEQQRDNSSSLMTVMFSWEPPSGTWTWVWIVGVWSWFWVPVWLWMNSFISCWFDWAWLCAETWSSVLGRRWLNVEAGWEASLHTASSWAWASVSSERALTSLCSASTWTGETGQMKTRKLLFHWEIEGYSVLILLSRNGKTFHLFINRPFKVELVK